jgi:hypothetical protein
MMRLTVTHAGIIICESIAVEYRRILAASA